MHGAIVVLVSVLSAAPLETKFAQVAPAREEADQAISRSKKTNRAVLLIHGLKIHPFSKRKAFEARLHSWQQPESELVAAISPHADVYSFAYGQNLPVHEIAESPELAKCIQRIRKLGYAELVLVGHSAGGLIARHFVEDHSKAGITKVVQICSPNAGSCWASATIGVRKPQEAFLTSLSSDQRQRILDQRAGRTVPDGVEFVCLVGNLEPYELGGELPLGWGYSIRFSTSADPYGDGLVSADSQWPVDLRRQGIPMMPVSADHCEAMHHEAVIAAIEQIVRQKQPRWNEQRLSQAEQALGEVDRFRAAFACVSSDAD